MSLKPIKEAQLVVVQREFVLMRDAYEAVMAEARHRAVPVVFEMDDLLIDLPSHHPQYALWASQREQVMEAIGRSDAVTVSTPYLANAISRLSSRIYVLPNYLDDFIWALPEHLSDADTKEPPVTIGFAGTPTHRADLDVVRDAFLRLSSELGSKIRFHFIGMMPDWAGGLSSEVQYSEFVDDYVRRFPKILRASGITVGVAPLLSNAFNEAKSHVKWLEYTASSIAGVYADLAPYRHAIRHGETGLLVSPDPREWYAALRRLVENSELRSRIVRNSIKDVRDRWLMSQNAGKWLDVYQTIVQQYRASVSRATSPAPCSDGVSNLAVSVVIPVYNNWQYTEQCLKAINDTADGVSHEVIVVDNGSTDGTAELIGKLGIPVRLVRNEVNRGFAAACNQGAAVARGRYLVFLNNDTVPKAGWLKALLDTAERPGVGIVGARLLYPDGRVQHAGVELINGIPDHPFRLLPGDAPEVTHERELDMVTGACLMISKALFTSLGGFDEVYINGVEDVDLCLRVRRAGYKVIYQPAAVVTHYESQTPGRFRYGRENLQIFLRRWRRAFDARGRLLESGVPQFMVSERTSLRSNGQPRVVWEGSQFVHHSLALVNRELCLRLMDKGLELSIVPYEPDQFTASVEARFGKLADRVGAPLSGPAHVHVRHQWPPNFTPPPEGHWVIIQPWEFGSLPRRWVEVMSTQVDEIWVPSSYVRQCYVRSGVPSDRVHVIPNGVDPDRFRPDVPPTDLARFGASDKRFKFLFVGGTIWRKGIDVLLKAYAKAFTSADDVCLVIKDMGGRSFYRGQTFEQEIRRLRAQPGAPAILYVDQDLLPNELPGLYRACDCLVHPYRGEGFGLPIAEAMACGLPVIVTNYGAALDFCNEDTAYLIPASERRLPERRIGEWETVDYPWVAEPDVEELARLMRYVYEHQEDARAKGLRASEHIRANFTWEQAAQKVVERIEALRERPISRFERATTVATPDGVDFNGKRMLLLAETRSVHFLLMPDWSDPEDTWLTALEQFMREFGPTEDVAVLLRVDPEEVPDTDSVASRLQEWAQAKGFDSDDGHLVLLVNDRLGPDERHLVYDAAHVFVATSTGEKGSMRTSEAKERGLLVCEAKGAAMREAWKVVLEREGREERTAPRHARS